MTDPLARLVDRISLIRLQPAALVVVKTTRPVSKTQAERLEELVKARVPGHPVLVVNPGIEVTVQPVAESENQPDTVVPSPGGIPDLTTEAPSDSVP